MRSGRRRGGLRKRRRKSRRSRAARSLPDAARGRLARRGAAAAAKGGRSADGQARSAGGVRSAAPPPSPPWPPPAPSPGPLAPRGGGAWPEGPLSPGGWGVGGRGEGLRAPPTGTLQPRQAGKRAEKLGVWGCRGAQAAGGGGGARTSLAARRAPGRGMRWGVGARRGASPQATPNWVTPQSPVPGPRSQTGWEDAPPTPREQGSQPHPACPRSTPRARSRHPPPGPARPLPRLASPPGLPSSGPLQRPCRVRPLPGSPGRPPQPAGVWASASSAPLDPLLAPASPFRPLQSAPTPFTSPPIRTPSLSLSAGRRAPSAPAPGPAPERLRPLSRPRAPPHPPRLRVPSPGFLSPPRLFLSFSRAPLSATPAAPRPPHLPRAPPLSPRPPRRRCLSPSRCQLRASYS